MSKVSQKSEVLHLRYINVCQYCKYYLKYWSKGINGPLDPWGGQNFQCFIKWDGLTGHGGVRWRAQINFLSKTSILNPSVHPLRWGGHVSGGLGSRRVFLKWGGKGVLWTYYEGFSPYQPCTGLPCWAQGHSVALRAKIQKLLFFGLFWPPWPSTKNLLTINHINI